ncbi:hypothetical protein PBY51_010389 [Eleginops maclovinus]|uniref:Uncharacterized protein n=1 Tax=Eleginops maclovinus TaxID=56733 RepID=A0AAN8AJ65_ELEMC|nr:hypothetical protein PBY51_010389 [Eleginops maclovinus]
MLRVDPLLSLVGEKKKKNIQRTLEMPPDFSMTNHRLSQCRAVGTGHFVCTKQCLGGMRGLVHKEGGKYDNSHSIQIYGQDRGAPLDACQGTSTTPPFYSKPAKANV